MPKPKMFFVAVIVTGECCSKAHLWTFRRKAATAAQARAAARRKVRRATYEPGEIHVEPV